MTKLKIQKVKKIFKKRIKLKKNTIGGKKEEKKFSQNSKTQIVTNLKKFYIFYLFLFFIFFLIRNHILKKLKKHKLLPTRIAKNLNNSKHDKLKPKPDLCLILKLVWETTQQANSYITLWNFFFENIFIIWGLWNFVYV